MIFPNTDNGVLLQEIHDAGIDLTVAHDIDFFLNFPTKRDAENMRKTVESNDNSATFSMVENDTNDGWVLCCTIHIIPTHDKITSTEIELDELSLKHNGIGDGWGLMEP